MEDSEVGSQSASPDHTIRETRAAQASDPAFRPGQFVRVRATGEKAVIMSHRVNGGTSVYMLGFVDDRIESQYSPDDIEPAD